jgi:hypothetical protein
VGGRIRSTEKSNSLIGNRTRDLPACSIVPHPTTLSRATVNNSRRGNIKNDATLRCETLPLTLGEEHRPGMSEHRILKKISEPQWKEVTEAW